MTSDGVDDVSNFDSPLFLLLVDAEDGAVDA